MISHNNPAKINAEMMKHKVLTILFYLFWINVLSAATYSVNNSPFTENNCATSVDINSSPDTSAFLYKAPEFVVTVADGVLTISEDKMFSQGNVTDSVVCEQHFNGKSKIEYNLPNFKLIVTITPQQIPDSFIKKHLHFYKYFTNVLSKISNRRSPAETSSLTNTIEYKIDIEISTDRYRAFGSVMYNRGFSSATKYRYGMNGKEKDDEIKGSGNSYDFGARMYDPRLGKWLTIDPLAKKFPSASPYCFSLNSPIVFQDYDGRDLIAKNKRSKERVMLAVEQAFGKNSDAFKFENNRLIFDQSKVDFTTTSDAQEILLAEFVNNVVDNHKVELNIKVTRNGTRTSPGVTKFTTDASDNQVVDKNGIIKVDIDLNPKVKYNLLEFDIDPTQAANAAKVLDKDETSGLSNSVSKSIVAWHEIGHFINMLKGHKPGSADNDKKTVGFENLFRKIIGFPARLGLGHGKSDGSTKGTDNKLPDSVK